MKKNLISATSLKNSKEHFIYQEYYIRSYIYPYNEEWVHYWRFSLLHVTKDWNKGEDSGMAQWDRKEMKVLYQRIR